MTPCLLWEKFVREIMDYNADLVMFLQTALGWGITGNTSEQVMFILIGNGANGKSICINVIMYSLGDCDLHADRNLHEAAE
jgi:putative DNA primase/helicase